MKAAASFYLSFLTRSERLSYIFLLIGRCLAGLLDVIGVMSVGYLATSIANFLSEGKNVGKTLAFFEYELPAVTAKSLPGFALFVAGLFIAKALISIGLTKATATRVALIEARAARSVSERVLGAGLTEMRTVSPEQLMLAVQVGAPSAFTGILNAFASLVSEGFLFVILSVSFLLINPLATLGMILYFGLLAFAIHLFVGKKLNRASNQAYENMRLANRALMDLTAAFRELAVSGKRDKYFAKIFQTRVAASKSIGQQTYLVGMPRHIVETGLIVGLGVFIYLQSLSADVMASAATIGVFLAGGFRIIAAMLPWQNALANIKINAPQSEVLWGLLSPDKSRQVVAISQQTQDAQATSPVHLKLVNVSFRYPNEEQNTISNVSLEIFPGQHAAFIGVSGAGKSTIVELILGLIKPVSGEIFVNGAMLSTHTELVGTFASYVPQIPGIVSGTIVENIALGDEPANIDKKMFDSAIRKSHLQGLLKKLNLGLDSNLGPQLDSLSGGQRQRIGLARALYQNRGLVILDEATSALDAESEAEIGRTISALKRKTTVISIAHRLNTIQNADVIFLVDEGAVIASGTLEDLKISHPSVKKAIELMTIG